MTKKMLKLGKKRNNKNKCQKIFGLQNLGNTCYANSVIQLILRNPLNYNLVNENKIDNRNKLYLAYLKLLKYSFTEKNTSTIFLTYSLIRIFKDMKRINHEFIFNIENDPKIFYKDFINGLNEIELIEDNENLQKFNDYQINPYKGEIENIFECSKCKNEEKFIETFLDLNLCKNTELLIQDKLINSFNEVYINEYYCNNCNNLASVKINKNIKMFPETLVILTDLENAINESDYRIIFNEKEYKIYGIIYYNITEKHYICKYITDYQEYILDDEIVKSYKDYDLKGFKIVMIFYNK